MIIPVDFGMKSDNTWDRKLRFDEKARAKVIILL
jgi:hypothetical protein